MQAPVDQSATGSVNCQSATVSTQVQDEWECCNQALIWSRTPLDGLVTGGLQLNEDHVSSIQEKKVERKRLTRATGIASTSIRTSCTGTINGSQSLPRQSFNNKRTVHSGVSRCRCRDSTTTRARRGTSSLLSGERVVIRLALALAR